MNISSWMGYIYKIGINRNGTQHRQATRNAPLAAASGTMDGSWMERKVTITALIFCKNTAYLWQKVNKGVKKQGQVG